MKFKAGDYIKYTMPYAFHSHRIAKILKIRKDSYFIVNNLVGVYPSGEYYNMPEELTIITKRVELFHPTMEELFKIKLAKEQ